jgi:polyphosphate kinase 2 (PPK2 family)
MHALVGKRAHDAKPHERLRRHYSLRGEHGILVVFEAVNAGGKDGSISELVSLLGDDALRVERFGGRITRRLGDLLSEALRVAPAARELVCFNRSYYGSVIFAAEQGCRTVREQCRRIVAFEERLSDGGTRVVKILLHIDKDEQLRRLEARQRRPELRNLHNPKDYDDQARWTELMTAYDVVISRTHTPSCPWFVIPGNERAARNEAVQEVLAEALDGAPPLV